MNEIHRVIHTAARRLHVIGFFHALAFILTIGIAGVLLTRLVERVFGLTLPWLAPYGGLFAWTGAAILASALAWTIIARKRTPAVARELDERAGLRESLSTALYAATQKDPWCAAVIETARAKAVTVRVGQAIPIQAPRFWPVPVLSALALVLIWFTVPAFDVMGILKKKQDQQKQQDLLVAAKIDIQAKDKKLDELLAKAKVDLKAEVNTPAADKAAEATRPEDIQRAAVKKLTDMSDRLNALKNGEKGEEAQAMKDAMRQLKQPGDGALNDFYKALSRGNFDKTDDALKDLAKQLSDNSLTDEQKEALKKQLENLAKQMEKVAQDKSDLEKKLAAAGMDPKQAKELIKKLASDPEALKKALEQMKNLSEEQKKQLMEAAAAACKAGQQCDKMGKAMSQMGQGLSKQGMDQQAMEGMAELGDQLSEMEMLSKDMEALEAALGECEGQLAELGECLGEGECDGPPRLGDWEAGDTNRRGSGSGGPGRGNYGAARAENPSDFTVKKEKAKSQNVGGPIIGSRLVYGEQVKGEAQAEFSAAAEAAEKAASEAIEGMQVQREHQNAVKFYFGTLSEKAKAKGKDAKPADTTPSKDAADAGKK